MKSQAELCTALAFTVMLACCSSGFVSAWHPDKKIAKWDPSFFQPVIYESLWSCGFAVRATHQAFWHILETYRLLQWAGMCRCWTWIFLCRTVGPNRRVRRA
ncbi:hypothetical protein RvY_12561-2 [Ramazzottius varieornatus]|uniref:Uncharacterized protein n=1 Tax=Ramazzottius varieornatus TaxID=947166 RepID=A0A1D1VQD5_RAMVA|nr:hypothetical protein RvY_12561-2 [Ramazzottius varieornatus]